MIVVWKNCFKYPWRITLLIITMIIAMRVKIYCIYPKFQTL